MLPSLKHNYSITRNSDIFEPNVRISRNLGGIPHSVSGPQTLIFLIFIYVGLG